MHKVWKYQGICMEADIRRKVEEQMNYDYQFYVAYQTDCFLAGKDQKSFLSRINWKRVLEIRFFSEKEELLLRRTMIGKNQPFQWRVASEDGLEKDEEYIVRYQTLDIDTNNIRAGECGNLSLISTGGGTYELPITEGQNQVKIISYVGYDSNDGMAYIYDNRFVEFTGGKS